MKIFSLLTLICCACFACKEDDLPQFVAGEIIVTTKAESSMEQVFEFINAQENSVETILSSAYSSSLPTDSLPSLLTYLNQKAYTNNGNRLTTGQIDLPSGKIRIFPKLFQMNMISNQQDWIQSMQNLKCTELSKQKILLFRVPEGSERQWMDKYKSHKIVELTELNYISEVNR